MDQNILAGTFGTVIIIFTIVLFLLWFLLPFAVFGIKGRLDELIEQNKKIISLLQNSNINQVVENVSSSSNKVKTEPTIQKETPK